MKNKMILICFACLGCVVLANVIGHQGIRKTRKSITRQFKAPQAHWPAALTQALAGEFKGMFANYMLLEIGSFVGSSKEGTPQEGAPRDWRNIYLALKQSLSLDPYFQQTYFYVQGNLPWDGKMPKEAIELLEISRQHRPWDHFPGHYIGFNYYYFLNDYAKASEVFLETAKIEGAPALYAILGARMALKTGPERSLSAIALLEGMLEDKDLSDHARLEIEHRVEALKGVMLLEQAVEQYRRRYQTNPSTLKDLVVAGILNQLPANPYADRYFYSSETGRVQFDLVR